MTKVCSVCKKRKSIQKFGKNRSRKDGHHSSCLLCEKIRNKNRSTKCYKRFGQYKRGAKNRNIEFNLTQEEFKEITSKVCIYCGLYSGIGDYCGIDRINSDRAYVKDNIVPCCNTCNMMKGTMSKEDFIYKIKNIYENIFVYRTFNE
jgi:hypothetical protein